MLEPCPECGCPGEKYDGHACEDYADRPLLLDLFCGAGGAAMGYHRAGFDVIGVDSRVQRHYPFEFIRADVFEFLNRMGWAGVAAVHASPPCQRFSALNNGTWGNATGHPDLIEPTRRALEASGLPYVIENVPGAPLRDPQLLCGTMFGLRIDEGWLRRHRLFETNFDWTPPPHPKHEGPTMGVYGHGRGGGPMRGRSANADQARRLMEMPWASRDGVSQAIPPAYTEHIGRQLLAERAARSGRLHAAQQRPLAVGGGGV
jgi:DNA (cytosine-5)-methyltransferase 1